MFSKILRPTFANHMGTIMRGPSKPLLVPRSPLKNPKRALIRPDQYDTPLSKKFHFTYVMKEYWETIPLFITTCVSVTVLVVAIIWAIRNKVDVVFHTHSRDNISRTMDLRNPSVHKMLIINQRYEPWPEMQDLLDKMRAAEKRALVRAQTCGTN